MTKPDNELKAMIDRLADSHYIQCASTYGEPGYTNPKKGVLIANWSGVDREAQTTLEQGGYDLEWADEWAVVNGKAYRTSPDCYYWEPRIRLDRHGEYLTPDDLPDWIEECKVDSVNQLVRCLPSWFPTDVIVAEGYELMGEEGESGFFKPMDDEPDTYVKKYIEGGANYVLFQQSGQSQPYGRYFCWVQMPTND